MRIELEEVASGSDEDSYWVTLGFRSPEEESDTLHLVCGKEEDIHPDLRGLYIERLDQGMSDYDLADAVVVSPDGVEVELNGRGQEVLKLPGILDFVATTDTRAEWEKAVQVLRFMAGSPNGKVLSFLAAR